MSWNTKREDEILWNQLFVSISNRNRYMCGFVDFCRPNLLEFKIWDQDLKLELRLLGLAFWHWLQNWMDNYWETWLDLVLVDLASWTWDLTSDWRLDKTWLGRIVIDLDLDLLSRTWNSTLQLNCLIWLELVLNLTSRTWKSPKETFHCWLETRLNCFVDKTLDFDLELPSKTLGLNWYFMQQ